MGKLFLDRRGLSFPIIRREELCGILRSWRDRSAVSVVVVDASQRQPGTVIGELEDGADAPSSAMARTLELPRR